MCYFRHTINFVISLQSAEWHDYKSKNISSTSPNAIQLPCVKYFTTGILRKIEDLILHNISVNKDVLILSLNKMFFKRWCMLMVY